jgi:hypothetical protein
MKMIAHQTIGMHLPSSLLTSLAQGPQKLHPICIVVENRFASVATAHHMITRSSVLNAQRPRHGDTRYLKVPEVSIVSSDPFLILGNVIETQEHADDFK